MKGIAWLAVLLLLLYWLTKSNEKYCACGAA
jgi:hypothetical protein